MTQSNQLKLDNQLCFSIYACSREISRLYRPYLEKLGLTYPQYVTLLVLWEKKEASVKCLGEVLYLDSGTLTPMLKRLEVMGLINRNRSKEDERTVIISLTEQGEKLKEEAACVSQSILDLDVMSLEEFNQLLFQMQDLLKRVHVINKDK